MLARRPHRKNINGNIENKINTEHVSKHNITNYSDSKIEKQASYKEMNIDEFDDKIKKQVFYKDVDTDESDDKIGKQAFYKDVDTNELLVENNPTYPMERSRLRKSEDFRAVEKLLKSNPTYPMEGSRSKPTYPDDIKISDIFEPIINMNNDMASKFDIDKIKSNDIYVGFSKNKNKFIFKDEYDKYMGSFNINNLIKYFGSVYDTNDQFITNVNDIDYQNGIQIIEKFIGKVNYNKQLRVADIVIFSPTESPFMGNIKMLMILNDLLYEFENNKLQNELSNVNIKIRPKIERIIKQFIYTLHNNTIRIISIVSNFVKDSNIAIKSNLINNSIKLMYRITNFVQDQMKIVMNKNKNIEEMQMISLKLNKLVISKYDNILNEINKQKKYILAKPKYYLSGGGDNKDSEYSDNSRITTISSSESSETSDERNIDSILSDNDIHEIYE
uniref:Uncharacterized protein n=1 Tax=Mimivirus LCMiAC02 TaxID=2506609 RepID=A0A4D5XF77_9VIRU|nr:MAG: hypothetical protein LCMiAC02_04430 [Mimivirus LCMiAC02]